MDHFPRLMIMSALSLLILPLEGKIVAALPTVQQPLPSETSEVVPKLPTPAAEESFSPVQPPDQTAVQVPAQPPVQAPVQTQIQTLLQTAQTLRNQGDSAAALAQLDEATVLAKTLPVGESRDRLLSAIGLQLIELKALDQTQSVAQAMTYETLSNVSEFVLRVELERALVKAYIQNQLTPQALQWIESLAAEMRDVDAYRLVVIETLAQQGEVTEAIKQFEQLVDQEYFRYVALNYILQAQIGAEQFSQAQAFLAQNAFTDPLSQSSGLNELAVWAARANRMEEATAIAQQIPAEQRAATLVSIAELCQAQGQSECAVNLLAAAAALPYPADNWSGGFESTRKIARAYAAFGYPEAAESVLNVAEQKFPTPPDSLYSAMSAFAQIGAFDIALQRLDRIPESDRNGGRFEIATAYTDQARYEQAITLLSQIPDGVLFPLPEYPDPKVELLNRILKETIQQEQFAMAKRAALTLQKPVDRVQALNAIATAYQQKQQPQLAVETLDKALSVASSIDKHGFYVDRHSYYEVSNADLLINIAQSYRTAGQPEKAASTLQSALQSEQAFKSDLQSPWFMLSAIKQIAQLASEWQQPDLRQAAVAEGESRIMRVIEQPDVSSELLIEQLTGLASLSYEPGTAPTETFTRSLARLETLREQAANPEQANPAQQLAILYNLIYLYNLTDQPQQVQARIEQALPLIAPLSADVRDGHYTRLALAIASTDLATDPATDLATDLATDPATDSQGVSQLLSLLSSTQKQVDALLEISEQFADKNQPTQALSYFEQAVALAQTSLSASNFESAMVAFANNYTFFNTGYYSAPPRTAAERVLMSRVPQYISNPNLRARVWISFAPNLSPTEAPTAYAGLSAALAEIPNAHVRRTLLWEGINEAIAAQAFEPATQLANALDGEYRQGALGVVEIARQR
jgi:hypothetical protein